MKGEPRRLPAGGLDDVDVLVAAVLSGEGDPTAVGAEGRFGLRPLVGREAPGVAALAGHDPDVVGVHESDFGGADRRLSEESRALSFADRRGEQEGYSGGQSGRE
jgi:hypothetical protein